MKVHWVTRLVVYSVIATLAGPFYDNWTSMEKYLFTENVYSDECVSYVDTLAERNSWRCPEQHAKVSILLPIARVAECLLSVVIGIFMDLLGPRCTAIVGVLLRLIGWTLMGFALHTPGGPIVTFLLLGMSTNCLVFPALTIGMYTQKYRYVGILVIGMCSCFSSLIIKLQLILLENGYLTAAQINYTYTLVCLLPMLALCFFFFPVKLSKIFEDTAESELKHVGDDSDQVLLVPVSENSAEIRRSDDGGATSPTPDERPTWTVKGFMRTLGTAEVIVCMFYFAFNFYSITYVQQTYSLSYRRFPWLLTLNEYMIPLAVVPCVIMSVLYMFCKPIWILLFMNFTGFFMHLLGVIRPMYGTVGVLLSISLVVTYSILNTQVYNYLESVFDETYTGSIVGALNTLCGVWLLVQALAIKQSSDPQVIQQVNLALALIRLAFAAPFLYFMCKSKCARTATSDSKQQDSAVQCL